MLPISPIPPSEFMVGICKTENQPFEVYHYNKNRLYNPERDRVGAANSTQTITIGT